MFYLAGAALTSAPPPMPTAGGNPPAGGTKGAGLPNMNEKAAADLDNTKSDNGGI
jgi:hypothetical protein